MTFKLGSVRHFKAGYEIRHELFHGCEMKSAYTPTGDYIGSGKDAYRLCKKRGIAPEKAKKSHCVCSIGFCGKNQKWYGWSHRAIYGFGIGHEVRKGKIPGSMEGFIVKNLTDAKRVAKAFARSVS